MGRSTRRGHPRRIARTDWCSDRPTRWSNCHCFVTYVTPSTANTPLSTSIEPPTLLTMPSDGRCVRTGAFPNQALVRKRRRPLAIEIQAPGEGTVRCKFVSRSRLVDEIDVATVGAHEGAATSGLLHRSQVDERRVMPGQRADIGARDRDGSCVRNDSLQYTPIPLEKVGREGQHQGGLAKRVPLSSQTWPGPLPVICPTRSDCCRRSGPAPPLRQH